MANEKNTSGEQMSPQWVEEQCRKFDEVLRAFTGEMQRAFRKRAEEGRHRWEDPAAAARLQMDLLSHAYYKDLCAGEEAHVANFAVFLWHLRMRREEALAKPCEPANTHTYLGKPITKDTDFTSPVGTVGGE